MKWQKINKGAQPTHGRYYYDWKEELAKEGGYKCVYCAISEARFGGIRNFHVEHYRPKSNPQFIHLTHSFKNLFYACSICNCFKGSDWPNNPNGQFNLCYYPDPSLDNYNFLFNINHSNGSIIGQNVASKYMVTKLFLNRPQLILERRQHFLEENEKKLIDEIKILKAKLEMAAESGNEKAKKYLSQILSQILSLLDHNKKWLKRISMGG